MGMTHSTYMLAPGAPEAISYEVDGRKAPPRLYTAVGAASLYTTSDDLTAFIQSQLAGGRGVVSPTTLALMRKPQAQQYGIDIWGLGTILYASNNAGGHIVGHEGQQCPGDQHVGAIRSGDGQRHRRARIRYGTAPRRPGVTGCSGIPAMSTSSPSAPAIPATLRTVEIGGARDFPARLRAGFRRAIRHHSPNAIGETRP